MKTLSIAEARRDLCSLAAGVAESGDSEVMSRCGKPCRVESKVAPDTKISETSAKKLPSVTDSPLFGMWADREDMKDPRAWIENMRNERMKRIGLA